MFKRRFSPFSRLFLYLKNFLGKILRFLIIFWEFLPKISGNPGVFLFQILSSLILYQFLPCGFWRSNSTHAGCSVPAPFWRKNHQLLLATLFSSALISSCSWHPFSRQFDFHTSWSIFQPNFQAAPAITLLKPRGIHLFTIFVSNLAGILWISDPGSLPMPISTFPC